jgi:hypothetical protein
MKFGEPLEIIISEFYEDLNLKTKVYHDTEIHTLTVVEPSAPLSDFVLSFEGFVQYFKTTNPEISLVRGIRIGDTIEEVVSKFPREQKIDPANIKPMSRNKDGLYSDGVIVLYGELEHGYIQGYILFLGDILLRVTYVNNQSWIDFDFDSDGRVSQMTYVDWAW